MNWNDYRFVLALGRQSSLTRAAEILTVNQTTVARRIKVLQDQLGIQLFDKLSTGFKLTEGGLEVFRVAEEIEQKLISVSAVVENKDRMLGGTLQISFSEMIGPHWNWAFSAFKDKYPEIDLVLSLSNTKISVMQKEADIAIRLTDSPPENLVGRKVARIEYALFGAKKLLQLHGADCAYNDYPWISWAPYCDAVITERWMSQHAPNAKTTYTVDSMALMLESVKQGYGIGFLPCIYGDSEPLLKRLRSVEPRFGQDMWILTHPDRRQLARVKIFMREMYEVFAQKASAFSGKDFNV